MIGTNNWSNWKILIAIIAIIGTVVALMIKWRGNRDRCVTKEVRTKGRLAPVEKPVKKELDIYKVIKILEQTTAIRNKVLK